MSVTPSQIRQGLRDALSSVFGERCYGVWPDQVNVPCAIVRPLSADPRITAGDTWHFVYEVVILAAPFQTTGYSRGQQALDEYLTRDGEKSVYAAIEADPTLGGIVASTSLMAGWDNYGTIKVGDLEYWSARYRVEVYG